MPESAASLGAVIVAAGSGSRMGRPSTDRLGLGQAGSGQALDKLFVPLGGRPVLAHALAAFQECDAVQRMVLVLPAR